MKERNVFPWEVQRAAARLRAGLPVAMPTETVYGLAADATCDAAVRCVFALKNRPAQNPLILHAATMERLAKEAVFSPLAERLAGRFWPGPLTLVLPRRKESRLSPLISAGLETVAVRCPAHPVARQLLEIFGGPLAAPSANRSGRLSPTAAMHVQAEFPESVFLNKESEAAGVLADPVALPQRLWILDGGPCAVGLESAVVEVVGPVPRLLRHGAIAAAELREEAPDLIEATEIKKGDAPASPGQLLRHYAPATPLRLEASSWQKGEALLAFGGVLPGADPACVFQLSAAGDVEEAASRLFAGLRRLDAKGCVRIAVMPIPELGAGRAINDRLRRAAASVSGGK